MGVGGWYRGGSKLAFIVHRKLITSCNVVVNSFRNQIPRTNHPLFHTLSSPKCYLTHPRCSAIQIRCGIRHDHRLSSPFVIGVARRYYSVDWMTIIMFIIGSGVLVIGIYKRIETVPFTNRTRFISLPHRFEALFGGIAFEQRRELLFKRETLPATHPESQRVRLIAKNIINSLYEGKKNEYKGKKNQLEENEVWIDVAYASHIPKPVKLTNSYEYSEVFLNGLWFRKQLRSLIGVGKMWSTPIPAGGSGEVIHIDPRAGSGFNSVEMHVHIDRAWFGINDDNKAVDDVKWVQNCRKKANFWNKPTIKHLKAYNWEILLVKDCTDFTALSLPGGKILLSTQLLDKLTTDDEIAVIIGHEVAHALARHLVEKDTKCARGDRMRSLYGLAVQDGDNAVTKYCHTFSTMVEAEADYIGLLLMASAGYDPRVAPEVYKKLSKIHSGDSQSEEFESGFDAPSWEKRARLLAEPKVKVEALLMYQEAIAGRED